MDDNSNTAVAEAPTEAPAMFHSFDDVPMAETAITENPFTPPADDPLAVVREKIEELKAMDERVASEENIPAGALPLREYYRLYEDIVLAAGAIPNVTPDMVAMFRNVEALIAASRHGQAHAEVVQLADGPLEVATFSDSFNRAYRKILTTFDAPDTPAGRRRTLPQLETVAELKSQGVSQPQIRKMLALTEEQLAQETREPGSVIGQPGWVHPALQDRQKRAKEALWSNPAIIALEVHRIQSTYAQREREPEKPNYPERGGGQEQLALSKSPLQQRKEEAEKIYDQQHGVHQQTE